MGANRSDAFSVLLGSQAVERSEPRSRLAPALRGLETARYPGRIHLTPREREVLLLLAEGLPNKLICRRLGIAHSTVKIHVARILGELNVSTRLQAVLAAQRLGLLIWSAGSEDDLDNRAERSGSPGQHLVDEPRQLRVG